MLAAGASTGHHVSATPADSWNAGDRYEGFMGRWSRSLARAFVEWTGAAPGRHWLDVGTGTGALASAIVEVADPASVVGCDPSGPFIESARSRLQDDRVTFVVAGVGSLPRREDGYDAVVSGLALNFFPDPTSAIEEHLEVACPGGLVGAFVWDYAGGMEFLRYFWDAAASLDAAASRVDEGRRFPVCNPDSLESVFRAAGAARVSATALSVATRFASFDDYWGPFLGGTGPAPSFVSGLSEEQVAALERHLRRQLPTGPDGTIDLQARAWAVLGYRE
jgi:SAM-dependent methyltransferase